MDVEIVDLDGDHYVGVGLKFPDSGDEYILQVGKVPQRKSYALYLSSVTSEGRVSDVLAYFRSPEAALQAVAFLGHLTRIAGETMEEVQS